MILQFCPDLVDGILKGTTFLDKAYETAQERKRAADVLMHAVLRAAAFSVFPPLGRLIVLPPASRPATR
jgi:hypothetical protein